MFNEEHLALQRAVREMVEKEIRPVAAAVDDEDAIPERVFRVMGEMGLVQIGLPEAYGGPGGDFTAVCLVREEISRALNRMQRDGILSLSRQEIVVLDLNALERVTYE